MSQVLRTLRRPQVVWFLIPQFFCKMRMRAVTDTHAMLFPYLYGRGWPGLLDSPSLVVDESLHPSPGAARHEDVPHAEGSPLNQHSANGACESKATTGLPAFTVSRLSDRLLNAQVERAPLGVRPSIRDSSAKASSSKQNTRTDFKETAAGQARPGQARLLAFSIDNQLPGVRSGLLLRGSAGKSHRLTHAKAGTATRHRFWKGKEKKKRDTKKKIEKRKENMLL